MLDEFGFEDEGRTFTCYIAVSHQSRPDPWWWFSVSNDERHKYAPFRAVRGDTKAVAEAAGGSLADVVKLNVFLTDLAHFSTVNSVMGCYFSEPFPARAAVGVASLPRGALVEADAVMVVDG